MVTRIIDVVRRWLRPTPRQTCWVYCPGCDRDLTQPESTTSWSDRPGELVNYQCVCGTRSEWDFDIAPVPILVASRQVTP